MDLYMVVLGNIM